MTHAATCICVTCEVLRKRVPGAGRATYPPSQFGGGRMNMSGVVEPPRTLPCGCNTGPCVDEDAERVRFESWFREEYGYVDGADAWPSRVLQQCAGYIPAWAGWRARALL